MATNCLKNTDIVSALEVAQNNSTIIFNLFYKNVEYISWLEQYHNLKYDNDHVICNKYKNGDTNGEIIIDNDRKCWYFARATGWAILPFNIGKYTFSRFKKAYFNNIDAFDKMFVNYMQEKLLNMYYIEI